MESIAWAMRTLDGFVLATPIALNLFICFAFFQTDFILLLFRYLLTAVRATTTTSPWPAGQPIPTGLVVIPSLLRNREDLRAITTTMESCAHNEYPSKLFVVASVDGRTEFPELFAELLAWTARHSVPRGVELHVTGTETRLGKMMAVEAGVTFMQERVDRGLVAAFPDLYFSVDGDGTLGARALELLAARLTKPHPLTGNLRRIVSGKICIRYDLMWQGWRRFFTIPGQIHLQVAREFLVSNVARFNWKSAPKIGVPGALYCTWSRIIRQAPRYMGFMQALGPRDWLRWWAGLGAPKFSESVAAPLPEALTGASDDTCIAFLCSLTRWTHGHLDFDAPRTPLHALGRILRSYFVERSHDYEPEARVFTYTPSTIKGLWTQRVRWNSSRVECAGRFWRAFCFHWEIGFPASAHVILLLNTVFDVGFYYILLPYYCFGTSHALLGFLLGYVGQTFAYTLYTALALGLERERHHYWRVFLCLPIASAYAILINCMGCVVGVTRDIFGFGNATNFAPEWTLKKGRCERIAIGFRVRRFFALCLRSILDGDVPVGWFWVGWQETRWTPSGFDGWTTRKRPRPIVPRPILRWPKLSGNPISPSTSAQHWIWRSLSPSLAGTLEVAIVGLVILATGIAGCSSAGAEPSVRSRQAFPHNENALENTPSGALCVSAGTLQTVSDNFLGVTSPGLRATLRGRSSSTAEVLFIYEGPTIGSAPLANGELRRQIGIKLRARDTCNVVYVMWHLSPQQGVFVSVKRNPGKFTHSACGDGGYLHLAPFTKSPTPIVLPGVPHSLRVDLSGASLRVRADGLLVWEGVLPSQAFEFDGPPGLRTDNGRFRLRLRVPRGGGVLASCAEIEANSHRELIDPAGLRLYPPTPGTGSRSVPPVAE